MGGRYIKHEMEIILFEDDCAFVAVTVSSNNFNSTRIQTYSTDDPDENFK
ncbi:MAG: hypothetical protein LUC38_07125 [Oscillospiraceae bacterium]|nr:hypothetical protein [Ruminococcus sp.]MCD8345716.1 hypothetical protein [Oscillospiraceae bacterium]